MRPQAALCEYGPARGRLRDNNVNGYAEVVSNLAESHANVPLAAEPKLTTVGEPGCNRLRDQPSGVSVPGTDLGRFVESRARVEHFEHFTMREPQRLPVRSRQRGQRLRELTTGGRMDPLQETPVRRGRDRERLVRDCVGKEPKERSDGEVFVDDDHGNTYRSGVDVVGTATEERVRIADLCK